MNDQLKKLFLEWESRDIHKNHDKGKPFIYDGAVDEEKWEGASPKILFLLKEAYTDDDKNESWSLCKLIRERWKEPKSLLWWNVGRWAYGIQHTTKDCIPRFPEDKAAAKALFEIAFVNIKKSGGLKSSDSDDLKKYVESDGDLIKKQVELINPDIIIFGYTWGLVEELSRNANKVSEWVYLRENRILINFYHPSIPWDKKIMYYALCAIYQKYLQNIDC